MAEHTGGPTAEHPRKPTAEQARDLVFSLLVCDPPYLKEKVAELIGHFPHIVAALADKYGWQAQEDIALYMEDAGKAELIMGLLTAYPEIAYPTSNYASFLLHDVARFMLSPSMIQALCQVTPEALLAQDLYGSFPLHHAAEKQNLAAVQILLQAAPQTLHMADLNNNLPLHRACWNGDSDVAQYLLQVAPEQAKVHGLLGFLPLHCMAWRKRPDHGIVQSLLKAFPEATMTANSFGNSPLHVASQNCCVLAVVKTLIRAAPQAQLLTNNKGDATLHCCMALRAYDAEPLHVLLHAAPQVIFMCDKRGCWPRVKLWFTPLSTASQYMRKTIRQLVS